MQDALINAITDAVRSSPLNRREDGGSYFDAPLVGFAAADDPLFHRYREVVGPFHLRPRQWLERAYPGHEWQGGTVISWVLPIHAEVRNSNRAEKTFPSRLWAHTRNFGEVFNNHVRREVERVLTAAGHRAVAPQLADGWQRVDVPGQGPASNWSERHAAYAAGLGTFSLNDGFITERGIAHRCGSVVTDLVLPPSPRGAASHTENCLFCREGTCGACIARCPAGALSPQGHDKRKCQAYTHGVVLDRVGSAYGVEVTGCGLCQTKVPCEAAIPHTKSPP